MTSRQKSQASSIHASTSNSTATKGMFESRPFEVQAQTAKNTPPADLKTSLMQAEKYGHHLSRMPQGSVSPIVQAKMEMESAKSTSNPSLSSQPIQFVYGKEERKKAEEFNRSKKELAEGLQQPNNNKKPGKKSRNSTKKGKFKGLRIERKGKAPATDKFGKDHVAPQGTTISNASDEVASRRTWGGGRTSGTSTVLNMSNEDMSKEARFALQNLKMNEATMTEEGKVTGVRQGVNKPTFHNYESQTSKVASDGGKRNVTTGEVKSVRPVLGLRGDQIHHLHGVEEE